MIEMDRSVKKYFKPEKRKVKTINEKQEKEIIKKLNNIRY